MSAVAAETVLDLIKDLEWQLTVISGDTCTLPNLLGYEKETGILKVGIEPSHRAHGQALSSLSDYHFFDAKTYHVSGTRTNRIEDIRRGKHFSFWEETIPGEIIYQWLLNLIVLDSL